MNNIETGLNVGIIGYGFAGKTHREALKKIPGIGQVAIVDTNRDIREQAQATGLPSFPSTYELLTEFRPDIVVVAAAPGATKEITKIIATTDPRPSELVVLEKPLAPNLHDAQEVVNTLGNTATMSSIGLTGKYHPEFVAAYTAINEGEIGEIVSMNEVIPIGGPNLSKAYLDKYGGVLYVNGIHMLQHWMDYVSGSQSWKLLWAHSANNFGETKFPDNVQAIISFRSVLAHGHVFWPAVYTPPVEEYVSTIVGTKGMIRVVGFNRMEIHTSQGVEVRFQHDMSQNIAQRHLPGFIAEWKALLAALATKTYQAPVPLSYALELHQMLDQIESYNGKI